MYRIDSKALYKGRVLDLYVDRVRLPNGQIADMELVHHRGAAAVVPLLPDGRVILLSQYRYPTGGELLEIPAGRLEPDEDPELCARRELAEETPWHLAEDGELVSLGWIWTTPGFADEKIWLYLARGLEESEQNLDRDEILTIETLPFTEAVEKAREGQIHDSKTVCALLRAAAVVG